MLSSLNVTIIPFLLGALISVEDVNEWNFGPEYTFHLHKITTVHLVHLRKKLEYNLVENVTAVVHCRPKVLSQSEVNESEILFCHAKNITVRTNFMRQVYKEWIDMAENKYFIILRDELHKMPEQLFSIKVDRQNVQNFIVKTGKRELHHYSITTDFIDQINIGIDLNIAVVDSMRTFNRGSYVISTLTQFEEDTTRASKCKTSGTIRYPINTPNQYDKDKEFGDPENKTNFQLTLLPISYFDDINKPFSIMKIRSACTYHSDYLMLIVNDKWKIRKVIQYFNKMEINDKKPKFTSHTRLEGDIYVPTFMNTYKFWQNVDLHLHRIKPARKELNITAYE